MENTSKLSMFACVIFSVLAINYGQAQTQVNFSYEFENVLSESQQGFVALRAAASGLKTLRLVDEDSVYTVNITLCVQPVPQHLNVFVEISDVVYSNDGPGDTVYVRLDGRRIGKFGTCAVSNWGRMWNEFQHSHEIGDVISLSAGQHYLTFQVTSDIYGLELDHLKVKAFRQSPDQQLFCNSSLTGSG